MSSKQSHMAVINQALNQFDIETQVRKFALQTIESYMKGNRQAFQYINQWHTKINDFQLRLSTAQNYYKKIQINVNSKVEVANNLHEKLQKFSQQFWENMNENALSLEQMRKNYANLIKETSNQHNILNTFEKNQKLFEEKLDKSKIKVDDQILKIQEKFNDVNQLIIDKNTERVQEIEKVMVKFSEVKAQMDTKSQHMTTILKDIGLYKDQKISLTEQINNLYEEIEKRVLKTEFSEIRRYIDTNISNQKTRVNQQFAIFTTNLNNQGITRQKSDSVIMQKIDRLIGQYNKQFQSINKEIKDNDASLNKTIKQLQNNMQHQLKLRSEGIEQCKQLITINQEQINKINMKIQELEELTKNLKERVEQSQSNIISFNNMLNDIQKQNLERNDQMRKMKLDTQDMENLSEKLVSISEKILLNSEIISKNQLDIKQNRQKLRKLEGITTQEIRYTKQNFAVISQTFATSISQLKNKTQKETKQIREIIVSKNQQSIQTAKKLLSDKLDTIKDQLQFLETVNQQISQFKQTFKKQIEQSKEINEKIKQKMESIFSMFTKLKTDFYIKTEALGTEQLKIQNRVKEFAKSIEQIVRHIGETNEIVTISLAAGLGSMRNQEKGQGLKLASMLEGWVIEIDEKDEKFKYRGQLTVPRILLQVALEYWIKIGDKIKNNFMENGKQIYNRITSGNDQYRKTRKRSISRRRQSQLPKLYK